MSNEIDYPAKYQLEDGSGFYLLETGTDYYIKELQNYYELVRVDGAVSFWPLSEASSASPAADLIGGNNGTYVGSPTMAQTGPLVGDTSTGVLFDGVSQQVTAAGSASYTGENGALSVECWLKPVAVDATGRIGDLTWNFTAIRASSGNVRATASCLNTSSAALFNQNGGTLEKVCVNTGGWIHAAWTLHVGTTTARMYLNGDNTSNTVDFPTDFPTITAFTGTPLTWASQGIEMGGTAGAFYGGSLALFAIYPTALTADQIARHYRCGLQFLPDIHPPLPSLAAY